MYAVIETGGKQYKVSPGEVIMVEKLAGEQGSNIDFDQVCLVVQVQKEKKIQEKNWAQTELYKRSR